MPMAMKLKNFVLRVAVASVDDGHKSWRWVVSASPKLRLASWLLRLCDDDGHRGRLRQPDCRHQPDDP